MISGNRQVDDVDRVVDHRVRRNVQEDAVGEERSVERYEGALAGPREAPQVLREGAQRARQRRGEVADLDSAGEGSRRRQLRCKAAVDEDEHTAREDGKRQALEIGAAKPGADGGREIERRPHQRCEVRVAPVLERRGREARFREAADRLLAERLQPGGIRCGIAFGEAVEAREVVLPRVGGHRAPAPSSIHA